MLADLLVLAAVVGVPALVAWWLRHDDGDTDPGWLPAERRRWRP